jgi:serine/threonine protein kinase
MKPVKQIDGYKIFLNQLLGQGSFGDVYVGVSDKTQQKFAVKVLNKLKSNTVST